MNEPLLIHGDCLEVMKSLPDKSVDMVLSDLPYGTTKCKWDTCLDLSSMWKCFDRICKPNAAVLLFAQTPFDKVLGVSNIEKLRYEWVWEKTHPTGHLNAKKMPMKAHENILVFYKYLPVYNPIKTSGHVRKYSLKRNDKCEIYGDQKLNVNYDSTERYPRDVLKYPSDKQRSSIHPTQKPVLLLEYLIRTYSNAGMTVLDACMGSGSTGVACMNTDREFVGIEKDSTYFGLASERIRNCRNHLQSLR